MAEYNKTQSRVCYEHGRVETGKKLYEFHGYCTCKGCTERQKRRSGNRNCITVTTDDVSKAKEAVEIITKWSCADGNTWLKTEYLSV